MSNEIIQGRSEYEELLKEIRELQARIVELTALRDDLLYHICPALRARYEEKIGSLEREILAAELYLREKQRILEILQAQLNRQQKLSVENAKEVAGEEFRAFEEELHRKAKEEEQFRERWQESQWEAHDRTAEEAAKEEAEEAAKKEAEEAAKNDAGDSAKEKEETAKDNAGKSAEEEAEAAKENAGKYKKEDAGQQESGDAGRSEDGPDDAAGGSRRRQDPGEELKKLYRRIVKRLHPDVNPNVTEREKELFNEAAKAYEAGDLQKMRAIWEELENGRDPEERFGDTPEDLEKLREMRRKLAARARALSDEISKIRSEYPYTMKEFLENEAAVEEKRAALQKKLKDLREANDRLAEYIEQMRKKVRDS